MAALPRAFFDLADSTALKRVDQTNLQAALDFQRELYEIQSGLPFYYRLKIIGETIFAGFLLLVLSPLLLGIAAAIRWKMGRQIFFKQLRIGLNGRPFYAYKFRTMRRDAPRVVDLGYNALEKIVDDPRVDGRIGHFLRRMKWDELPQLYNVLRGDMLLIGPRPYMYEENFDIQINQIIRFAVKPGISGLWQAKHSDLNNAKTKIEIDCQYVDNLSFKQDLWIFFRTLVVVSKGEKIQRVARERIKKLF